MISKTLSLVVALTVVTLAACESRGPAAPAPSNTVTLEVTEQGFVPANVVVAKDKPVKLVVTRKTDNTCATEIVIEDFGIRQKLPLNEPVTVTFTPKGAGPIHYACGMNMVGGVITAQ